MDYCASLNNPEPIMPSQLPDVRIDYRGLINYAKEVGKTVADLSGEEKNAYISGNAMSELRKNDIYNYY